MRKLKSIGIMGYGTIGSYIADKISKEKEGEIKIGFISEKDSRKYQTILEKKLPLCMKEEIIQKSKEVDLVVETASFEIVNEFAPDILRNTNMIILSISALFYYEDLKERLESITGNAGTKLYIPHGAILGLDGIFDGRNIWERINITTTKSPTSFIKYPEQKSLEELGISGIVYEGPTAGACKLFPRNVNSHGAVALAAGSEKTFSKIIADPTVKNLHKIEAIGSTVIKIEIESGKAGKVTSAHVPESAYNSILRILEDKGVAII